MKKALLSAMVLTRAGSLQPLGLTLVGRGVESSLLLMRATILKENELSQNRNMKFK